MIRQSSRSQTNTRSSSGYSSSAGSNVVELVSNGGFGSDTIWTKNTWTIAAGVATATAISTALTQSINIQPGTRYVVTFTVATFTGGSVTPILGGTSGTERGSAATFAEVIRAGSTDTLISFSAAAATLDIDNVSVLPA